MTNTHEDQVPQSFAEHRTAAEQKYFCEEDVEYLVALQFSGRGGCPND